MQITEPAAPQTIHLYGQSLGPQERSKHRFWIGLRVEALMESYWQTRPTEAVKEMIVLDWLEALEAFTPGEITKACREYTTGPDRGKKPKTGDIRALILADRKITVAAMPRPVEPVAQIERYEPTAEERRQIAESIMAKVYGLEGGAA